MNETQLLEELVADHLDDLTEQEQEAFPDMLDKLKTRVTRKLSIKQREWVDSARARLGLADAAANLYSAGSVPDGQPVITPDVLRHLPKKPPGRR